MTATMESDLELPGALDDLCRTVFRSVARSDQRRWAAAYVRGLVHVPGRKSVRRISEHVAGASTEQCLQQFVNQSPWHWAPVRQMLGWTAESVVAPRAWVVQEIEFPKRGSYSVGVATQYVPGARRTFNCQLGMAVWLAGATGSVPVNWRLMLPPAWDADHPRRRLARLPDDERHRVPWEHIMSCIDEMIESWDLTPRPVVADRWHDHQVEPLVHGLEERGLRYAIRISGRTPVSRERGPAQPIRAGNLIRSSAAHRLIVLPERSPTGARITTGGSPLMAHAVVPPGSAARPAG
ncbi:MAG TPA: transposase, partial [Pseudonocardiaceae bacterium]|nr:transposase [Pseudonocardiaceae bacterium]